MSRSHGNKVQKQISGNRVTGVSLHSIECQPFIGYIHLDIQYRLSRYRNVIRTVQRSSKIQ